MLDFFLKLVLVLLLLLELLCGVTDLLIEVIEGLLLVILALADLLLHVLLEPFVLQLNSGQLFGFIFQLLLQLLDIKLYLAQILFFL